MGNESAPDTQEPTKELFVNKSDRDFLIAHYNESVQRDTNSMGEIIQNKVKNIELRSRGEISDTVLDRLNKEDEVSIQYLREEINRLMGEIQKVKDRFDEPASGANPDVSSIELNDESIEESPVQKSEVGSSLYKKLEGAELYKDRIKSAHDFRNLFNYISELGDITASDGYVYKKEDLLGIIGNLKDSNDPNLQKVTGTYGLRDQVKLLLLKRELGI